MKIITNTKDLKISYSQCGEDLIIDFIFKWMKITKPSYLDIGAHHPINISNTYFFYENGCTGVCIEPDPILFVDIKRRRKRDICLNLGIGIINEDKADFYIMSSRSLNTFSKDEAERYQSYGNQKIEAVIQMPLMTVNQVIDLYCRSTPNFISLDVEGLDLQVLQSFDFNKYRPEVFCVETLTYTEDKSERKISEIIDCMLSKGYFVYADTFINTIFVDKLSWSTRR